MNKKTLIFNCPGLSVGGVETYFYSLIKYSLSQGYRVVWITTQKYLSNAFYKDIVQEKKVEKIICSNSRFRLIGKPPKIEITKGEDVTMVSFTPEYFIYAEHIRYRYIKKGINIKHYLILMNFFGEATYPDQNFKLKNIKKFWYKYCTNIFNKIVGSNCLFAFSLKHLEVFEQYYNLNIKNKENKKLPILNLPVRPTEEEMALREKSRHNDFTIVACSRFDFPHKGFIIGLIKKFPDILSQKPNVKLKIIGYGDKARVESEIDKLDENVKNRIEIIGQISKDELILHYKEASLCIGLAGAISTGASIGIPSLVVRHNSFSCEAYGLYSETSAQTLRDDSGEDVVKHVLRVVNMPSDKYIETSLKEYETYIDGKVANKDFIFEQTPTNQNIVLTKSDLFKGRLMGLMAKVSRFMGKIK